MNVNLSCDEHTETDEVKGSSPHGREDPGHLRMIESPLYEDFANLFRQAPGDLAPVNWQKRTAEEIEAAADYGFRTGTVGAQILDGNDIPLTGTILEIGPGWDLSGALILGEQAHELIVADRFLVPWDDEFHPHVYRLVQQRLGRPSRKLDRVVNGNAHTGVVRTLNEPAYHMPSLGDRSVDVIYSNAVLEHVHPIDLAAREMFRITRPGGWGAHQVDFRCHRDFSKPLEHLLLSRSEFDTVAENTHAEVGCQTRVGEMADSFRDAGFRIHRIEVNMVAEPAYLDDFMGRLRRAVESPYRGWPREEVANICARLFLQRPH
jgi:SAM-dependent methyltransferase